MNPLINLGNTQIDAYQYAIQGNVILGTRSAGKTHTGKYIAESLMDLSIPVVVIDPISKWRYMRDSNPNNPNGKSYPIIIVGKDGDVELSPDTIEDVMRVALQTRSSIVIDLFDKDILDMWDEIVSKIFKLLLYENEPFGLRHVFLEEASEFVHQQNKKTESSIWIEKLVRLSGNVKTGISLINQNPESISKNILKLCDGRIVGRQTEKNSIDMAKKWLAGAGVENATEISQTLPNLKSGQFWVWSTNDNNPVLTTIPDIKSLHPSRNTMGRMDTQAGESLSSVLDRMNLLNSNKPENLSPVDYVKQAEEIINDAYPEIEISIDVNCLGYFEKNTFVTAHKTPYGTSTVADTIDGLIRQGYTIYNDALGYLQNENTGRVFTLNSKLENSYAKLIISKLQ